MSPKYVIWNLDLCAVAAIVPSVYQIFASRENSTAHQFTASSLCCRDIGGRPPVIADGIATCITGVRVVGEWTFGGYSHLSRAADFPF